MTDPCDCIQTINFDREEDQKNILIRDKHTRIEGLFTEIFFYEEIVKDNFSEFTSSWWFALKDFGFSISKLTLSVSDLKPIDIELLEYFSRFNKHVFIIEFCQKDKTFYYGKYSSCQGENFIENWGKTKRVYPKNPNNPMIPSASERNQSRSDQAITYLKEKGTLKKCAVERIFANCWLGNGSFWDIDFFVKRADKFVAFEVKQKFPTAKGTWGLNSGLAKLFTYLDSHAITVVHVILKKPVNDASIPAIDLYTKEIYRKNAYWIATRFSGSLLQSARSMAPSYTSIHGNSPLSYYHLQQEDFSMIKTVGSDINSLEDFLQKNVD